MAQKLSGHLLQELVVRGSRGGPLFPLSSQLNTNVAHLLGQRIETMLGQLPAKCGRRWLAWAKPRDRPRRTTSEGLERECLAHGGRQLRCTRTALLRWR